MLTRQGWLCLWAGLAMIAVARLLGIGELYVFGAVALGLVVVALLYVRLVRLDLRVHRVVHPSRVHVGQASRVEVRIRNLRRTDTPVLRLRDPVSGTTGAELLVPPLDQGAATSATYRLPTDRRGIVAVGPLRVVVGDPFGLAQAGVEAAPRVELTVLPRVEPVRPVPYTSGNDPLAGVLHPTALGRSGDDFYALRPYVVGDDLRRIHWPSTARHDELLVRQQEQPWQGRTTVLLDVRRAAHDADSFEAAVSAAASIVAANGAQRDLVRLVTTDGADSGFGSGGTHVQALLEHLAVVDTSGSASLRTMLDLLRRDGQGALVVVVGRTAQDDLRAAARLRQRFGLVTVVQVTDDAGAPGAPAASATLVRVTPSSPFAPAWDRAMRAASSRRARAGVGT
ncbi:MAG: DUF58 domain-containing protein [Thermoanaerobacterales bacterium]|jgi:uncharacterized protein (DUF58 family)|nr:DUF58 domain-containing protein [Thermoanaerobacterales bacterium]